MIKCSYEEKKWEKEKEQREWGGGDFSKSYIFFIETRRNELLDYHAIFLTKSTSIDESKIIHFHGNGDIICYTQLL